MGEMDGRLAARRDCAATDYGGGANAVRLPDGAYAAFRLLLRLRDDLVGHQEGLRAQIERIREGRKVLLFTSLVPLMASFVAGYLIWRQEGGAELGACL